MWATPLSFLFLNSKNKQYIEPIKYITKHQIDPTTLASDSASQGGNPKHADITDSTATNCCFPREICLQPKQRLEVIYRELAASVLGAGEGLRRQVQLLLLQPHDLLLDRVRAHEPV